MIWRVMSVLAHRPQQLLSSILLSPSIECVDSIAMKNSVWQVIAVVLFAVNPEKFKTTLNVCSEIDLINARYLLEILVADQSVPIELFSLC